ncbi:hypothetical protein G1H11_14245 [Phytoactinopolyspora alkaliphila]|uniref:Uncharacterized protein n=1 Tax=Phytoactinopolyspora alkaliphila TaxID=1783498 RepID=A0A6N9YNE4_9ACTN|nr:hypothetical protein [Phytoactinopolyspora alkaliphila]NED96467.1 hypothetical protein [Phytoactinopolyspora alkaliphila]
MADDNMTRDRDGDLYPDTDDHVCKDGWLGEDHDGRPAPCPRCRPHLHRRTAPGGPTYLTTRNNRRTP